MKASAGPLMPISREQWLEAHIAPAGDEALAGAWAYIAMIEKLGGEARVSPAQKGSISAVFTGFDGKTFSPLNLWSEGPRVSFSLAWLDRPNLHDDATREQLLESSGCHSRTIDQTRNLRGFPSFKVALLADPDAARRVTTWLGAALDLMR